MCTLARYGGVGPTGTSTGRVDVGGRSWELCTENNGQIKVFSLVAPNPVTSFSADAKQFFVYLQSRRNFPIKTQNLLGESKDALGDAAVKACQPLTRLRNQSSGSEPNPLRVGRQPSTSPSSL